MSEIGLQTLTSGSPNTILEILFGVFSYLKVDISLVTPLHGIELFSFCVLKTEAVYFFSLV